MFKRALILTPSDIAIRLSGYSLGLRIRRMRSIRIQSKHRTRDNIKTYFEARNTCLHGNVLFHRATGLGYALTKSPPNRLLARLGDAHLQTRREAQFP